MKQPLFFATINRSPIKHQRPKRLYFISLIEDKFLIFAHTKF
jgi:hypothetical protein